MFLAELAGREAEMALEHLGEVVHITNAAVLGHRLHLQLGVAQEIGGGVHPHIGDILCHRLARLLMKQGGDFRKSSQFKIYLQSHRCKGVLDRFEPANRLKCLQFRGII